MTTSIRALLISAATAATLLLTSGCNTTSGPVPGKTYSFLIPDLPESGFLGDYSQLTLAKQPEFAVAGRKVYVDPAADLTGYGMVVIDPYSFKYLKPGVTLTEAQKGRLIEYMDEWLNMKLKNRFQKVAVPGPKTLRVRAAVTDVSKISGSTEKGNALADMAKVLIELELVDSESGHRFLAMVDQADVFRFTIAKEDHSAAKEAYFDWFDGVSSQMDSTALNAAATQTEN